MLKTLNIGDSGFAHFRPTMDPEFPEVETLEMLYRSPEG